MYTVSNIGQGKVYLPKKVWRKYFDKGKKEEFYVLDLPGELVLIPKPADPVAELRKYFAHDKRAAREIKAEINEIMGKELER